MTDRPSIELSQSWLEQHKVPGYKIEKLNALSAPKGTQYTCELTGAPARVCLVTPLLTLYFATRHDAVVSWEGILYRLLPLLAPLRQKPAIIGSEEERTRRVYAIQLGKFLFHSGTCVRMERQLFERIVTLEPFPACD
jgi:hypothetical protein